MFHQKLKTTWKSYADCAVGPKDGEGALLLQRLTQKADTIEALVDDHSVVDRWKITQLLE